MSPQIERAVNNLYAASGSRVANVKFFLGSDRRITGEQLADQVNRANAQIRAGLSIAVVNIDGDI